MTLRDPEAGEQHRRLGGDRDARTLEQHEHEDPGQSEIVDHRRGGVDERTADGGCQREHQRSRSCWTEGRRSERRVSQPAASTAAIDGGGDGEQIPPRDAERLGRRIEDAGEDVNESDREQRGDPGPEDQAASGHEQGLAPDEPAELLRPRPQGGGDREGAAALLEAERQGQPRGGHSEHERETELDPRQPREFDRRQVGADDLPLVHDVGHAGAGSDHPLDAPGHGGRAGAVGLDQEAAHRRRSGPRGHVGLIGDEERVLGCGGELLGHPLVVERHGHQPPGAPVLKSEIEEVTGVQLVVVDGLLADQDRVGVAGEDAHQTGRRPSGKPGVLKPALTADGGGTHPEQVLQVSPDVGIAVLQGLDARHAGKVSELGRALGRRDRRPRETR